jgi:galactokinase
MVSSVAMRVDSAVSMIGADYVGFLADLKREFLRLYGTAPQIFRAPGRVNLIGEHTDYNDGFVMPVAIQFCAYVALAPRADGKIRVYSQNFNESAEFALIDHGNGPRGHWSDYVRGVAKVLRTQGVGAGGADLLIHSDVPIGAGLSSSAAIEVAAAFALLNSASQKLAPIEIAKACQRAEHEYVGSMCGIMDQFVACFGQAGHTLMLDCRSLTYELLPAGQNTQIVVCDTGVRHKHASSGYNERRADCDAAVRAMIAHGMPAVRALRDVSSAMLKECRSYLPERVYRRCRHVITENQRVTRAADALTMHDMETFGQLMYESHASLQNDYEVSCRELDLMVDLARTIPGVYGSRMTGGGFGGCTVNLVRIDAVEQFITTMQKEYQRQVGILPEVYVCVAAQGAGPA